jgi:general secretion pathway protein G
MNTIALHRHQRRLARRGFTLMEIIVVVTIIALLAALVAPKLLSQFGSAKVKIAQSEASGLASAVNIYLVDKGLSQVPEDFDLGVLLLAPESGGGPNGPYLQKADDLIDPWDREYRIRVPGEVNVDFDVVSYGEDGQPGGEGANKDVTN